MSQNLTLHGFDRFYAALNGLKSDVPEGAKARLLTGAEVMKTAMERRAPVGATGKYSKSFIAEIVSDFAATVVVEVGPDRRKDHGFLSHMLEYGTSPHPYIKGGRKGSAKRKKIERLQAREQGVPMHKGTLAQPHMRPAFMETADQVLEIIGEGAAAALNRGGQ